MFLSVPILKHIKTFFLSTDLASPEIVLEYLDTKKQQQKKKKKKNIKFSVGAGGKLIILESVLE